jgi:hypothetical protein
VYEVRRLSELAARLNEKPASLAFIEVHGGNLASVLNWLTDVQNRFSQARFVALVDRQVTTQEETWPAESTAGRHDVASVLLEAGAIGIVDSPRDLQPALTVAKLHATRCTSLSTAGNGNQPLNEWALSLLPWQGP